MPEIQHAVERDADSMLDAMADEALLARFHAERDEPCFAELVRRHQQSAFRVAFARCGNQELAEEAAQEAFLQISRTESGPPRDLKVSFRFWFFGVVSNIALNSARSERRISRRARSPRHREEAMSKQPGPRPDADVLAQDQRKALEHALGNLGEDQRLPIILHFMEGLTQDQIGQIVGVTQSVIARRIANGLEALRSRLAQAGVGLTAVALPELLRSNALLRLPQPLQLVLPAHPASGSSSRFTSSRSLRKVARAPVAKGLPALAIVFAAVAALGLLAWAMLPAKRSATPASVQPALSVPALAPIATPHIDQVWDFQKTPPPADLTIAQGSWNWVEGTGMKAEGAVVLLPIKTMRFPILIELSIAPLNQETFFAGAYYSDGRSLPALTCWAGHIDLQGNEDAVMQSYLTEHEVMNRMRQHVFSIESYREPPTPLLICVALKNAYLKKIAVRSMSEDDLKPVAEEARRMKQSRGAGVPREPYSFKP